MGVRFMARILVIEQNVERQHMLKFVLEANGHTVIGSAELTFAWLKLQEKENRVDMVVCSCPQEGMAAFLQNKYRDSRFERLPIIFLMEERKAKNASPELPPKHVWWVYLTYPLNLDDLMREVDGLLSRTPC